MSITLPDLPFQPEALEPHISRETIETHYGKHHRGYVKKTNAAVENIAAAKDLPLDDLIRFASADTEHQGLLNNAAQVWNHTAYWNSLSPDGGGKPSGALAETISGVFGNYESFRTQFKDTATSHFGSGWAWLTTDGSKLMVRATHDAGCPLLDGETVLVCCDVWEHAYYLDVKSDRARYVDAFLDHLINWRFAENAWNKHQAAHEAA